MSKRRFLRLAAFGMALMLALSFAVSAFAYSTIPYGKQGDEVRKMQNKLKEKGFLKDSVDGKFGPETQRAVRKFQKSVGIKVDGKPGEKTLTALYEGTSKINQTRNSELKNQIEPKNPRTLYYGCTGARVKELQRALKAADCYGGSIDGVYGDLTLEAVKKYQYKRGLHADGMAGSKTLASLNRVSGKKVRSSFLLAVGSKGAEVKKMQGYLSSQGYAHSDTGGEFGYSTEEAVKNWQKANGYEVTGSISESQYNKLFAK